VSSTRERLERLFPPKRPSVEEPPQDRKALKERLERLIAKTASRPRRERVEPPLRREAVPLERAIDGREVVNERGSFYAAERTYPLHHRHGRIELERLRDVPRGAFSILARGSDELEIDLERALFIDTETTGLAGGSGTYAFLIGLGYVEDDAFVVRQLFMRDYREEAAMLRELSDLSSRFDLLVSYNGKSFDVPLLETRYVLCRQSVSFEEKLHFDLLHPARSLWKARYESCRLSELEARLLGIERENDPPGFLIPDIYFRYVRTGDASSVPYVFEHNRHDILSLAALTVSAADMLDESHEPDDPIDDFSLGRLFERGEEAERSILHYARAVDAGVSGPARRRSLRGLAELHKRRGDVETARAHWEELSREDGAEAILALHELAMHREHRERDYAAALSICEDAVARIEGSYHLRAGFREKWREAFERRRRRLVRRLAR
jgi:hypothetical protein